MARIRTTFFFKSDRGYGWTETIFSTRGTLPAALLDAKALLPIRVNMLGQSSYLPYLRVSDDEIRRDSQIYAVPLGDQTGKLPDLGQSDIANTCLILRLEATDTVRRTLSLRGIPDDIVLNSGQYAPTAVFQTALTAYKVALTAGAWAVKAKVNAVAPRLITLVGPTQPDGFVLITTAINHGFAPGDVIDFTEMHGAKELRGRHVVNTVPNPNEFSIFSKLVVSPLGLGGKVATIGSSLAAIRPNGVIPIRVSHRNAGRPFDAPRGRRSGL